MASIKAFFHGIGRRWRILWKKLKHELTGIAYERWLNRTYGRNLLKDIEPELNTGDILLLQGWESFSSWIMTFTGSSWSHVALLIKNPSERVRRIYQLDPNEQTFVLESDLDTLDERQSGGIQLVPIKKLMRAYEEFYGEDFLYVMRQLNMPYRHEKDCISFPELDDWLIAIHGAKYNDEKSEIVKSIFRMNQATNLKTFFCSEIVAATYQKMGLIESSLLANNYLPRDFSEESDYFRFTIQLMRDSTLGKEKRIVLRPAEKWQLWSRRP